MSGAHDDFLAATLPALDLVYNLARRMTRNPMDAEDIVQDTYVRAFEAWTQGRKPRKVEPWMATICLNLGRSAWRRRNRDDALTEIVPPPARDVEEEVIEGLARTAVHEALWALPEEQRIAISLMDLGGLTAAETARIVGSPRGTVLARVHRGRKKLARLLEKEVNVDP